MPNPIRLVFLHDGNELTLCLTDIQHWERQDSIPSKWTRRVLGRKLMLTLSGEPPENP